MTRTKVYKGKRYVIMPDYEALRQVEWQLFITLTFKESAPPRRKRERLLKAFLAELAAAPPASHFPKLLWLVRYERNLPDGHGHYHACVAGLDLKKLSEWFCIEAERWWTRRTEARAEVKIYVKKLDGLGYVLKRPKTPAALYHWQAAELTAEWDELQPTLSESLLRLLRKTR